MQNASIESFNDRLRADAGALTARSSYNGQPGPKYTS
jgi:hypothetical protein